LEPSAEKRFSNKNVQIVRFGEKSQEPYIIAMRRRMIIDDYEKFWEHISAFRTETENHYWERSDMTA